MTEKYDYNKVCDEAAAQLDQATRQNYLDLLKEGKTLGQARELACISFEAALAITTAQIRENTFFDFSAPPEHGSSPD